MVYLIIWLIGVALTAFFYVLYEIFDLLDDFRGIYTNFWYDLSDFCYRFAPIWVVMSTVAVFTIFIMREVMV